MAISKTINAECRAASNWKFVAERKFVTERLEETVQLQYRWMQYHGQPVIGTICHHAIWYHLFSSPIDSFQPDTYQRTGISCPFWIQQS